MIRLSRPPRSPRPPRPPTAPTDAIADLAFDVEVAEPDELDEVDPPTVRVTAFMRERALLDAARDAVYRRCDQVFAWLMIAQLVIGVGLAFLRSSRPWGGLATDLDPRVAIAFGFGGTLTVTTVLLTTLAPGRAVTRHVVAVCQVLWSAIFIHVNGDRTETHFHVFGSLAFIAYYRDVRVLATATAVVIGEHAIVPLLTGTVAAASWWHILEHAVWVAFEDTVLVMGIAGNLREMRALAQRQAATEAVTATIEQKVVHRTRALQAGREQLRHLVETVPVTPYQLDPDTGHNRYIGPQGAALLGCDRQAWLAADFWDRRVHPDDRAAWAAHVRAAARGPAEVEVRLRHDDGSWVTVRSLAHRGRRAPIPVIGGVLLDVTEQRRLELELRQAQKLESVGRLASGVAHEINTPVQFVSDSVSFVREAFVDVMAITAAQHVVIEAAASGADVADAAAAAAAQAEADLPYLEAEVPRALERCTDGLDRIATLVRSMKEFAHPDRRDKRPADLNRALEATVTLARHEYKFVADVELDLAPLPPVVCHVSELNQVFLNLVVNAAHAIADVVGTSGRRGTIGVATRATGDHVTVTISDTGTGIPDDVRAHVFDPFFTTKAVGKGSGQGLAIARNVIVDKHGGTIGFDTAPGRGTTFTIRIPIEAAQAAA